MTTTAEVREFLIALRGRLTPAAAGISATDDDRRVPGLRREEVAQLAGVSTAYYTRMERGDLAGVSEGVLSSLARALRLSDAERLHLFDLARSANGPTRLPRSRPAGAIPHTILQLIDTMAEVPTFVLTRIGDPLAGNPLGRLLFPDLFPPNAPALNTARYLFLDPRSRTFYAEWESVAKEMVAVLRFVLGRDPEDRAVQALVGELAAASGDFRTWWASHTVHLHTSGTKLINHPVVGEVALAYNVLSVPGCPEIALTTFLAEPGSASANALGLLRSWMAETSASPPVRIGIGGA